MKHLKVFEEFHYNKGLLGYTKLGKPVYQHLSADHEFYKDFTTDDHLTAADLHAKLSDKYHDMSYRAGNIWGHYQDLVKKHNKIVTSHEDAAFKKIEEEPDYAVSKKLVNTNDRIGIFESNT